MKDSVRNLKEAAITKKNGGPLKDGRKGREENQSVRRALDVLDVLAGSLEPIGVRELARTLGFAPSIAQRLLITLANAGYVEQKGVGSRYVIGYKSFQVGNTFLTQNSFLSLVMPELESLANLDITGFLGVLRQSIVVYLATVQGNGPIAVKRQLGSITHPHSTALGKALLSEYSDAEVTVLLPPTLPQLTKNTTVSLDALLAELAQIRKKGYALNDQENRVGVFSVGAVIRDATGTAVGALSGAVPSSSLDSKSQKRIIGLVVESARRVSQRLGSRG
jgi:DNA-binding IclR family transcriptional regulator